MGEEKEEAGVRDLETRAEDRREGRRAGATLYERTQRMCTDYQGHRTLGWPAYLPEYWQAHVLRDDASCQVPKGQAR